MDFHLKEFQICGEKCIVNKFRIKLTFIMADTATFMEEDYTKISTK